MSALGDRLAARIAVEGPLSYGDWVEACLYDPHGGFYATGGAAGRRGDFLTSAEVGPLFGAVLATALDTFWREAGRPDPFVVVECGAGSGALARAVLHAAPACAGVLRYVAVERSPVLASQLPDDPRVDVAGELPAGPLEAVVLANELLDNLAFDVYEWHGGRWREVRIGLDRSGGFREELADPTAPGPALPPGPWAEGTRLPWQRAAAAWLAAVRGRLRRGRVVVVDYGAPTRELAQRPGGGWLRTYRSHGRGDHPLVEPGSQDITTEVDLDQLAAVWEPHAVSTQAAFLARHGIDDLVAQGRRIWRDRAHLGDLDAMRARSRVREAEALCDPAGLGAFQVIEWVAGPVGA